MTTRSHADLLAEIFAANGLEPVVVAELAEREGGSVAIWPYAVDVIASHGSEALPARAEGAARTRPGADHRQRTHMLVLPPSLHVYDQAREIVLDNPVLRLGDVCVQVDIEPLLPSEAAHLFLASQVKYRVALAVVVSEA